MPCITLIIHLIISKCPHSINLLCICSLYYISLSIRFLIILLLFFLFENCTLTCSNIQVIILAFRTNKWSNLERQRKVKKKRKKTNWSYQRINNISGWKKGCIKNPIPRQDSYVNPKNEVDGCYIYRLKNLWLQLPREPHRSNRLLQLTSR